MVAFCFFNLLKLTSLIVRRCLLHSLETHKSKTPIEYVLIAVFLCISVLLSASYVSLAFVYGDIFVRKIALVIKNISQVSSSEVTSC